MAHEKREYARDNRIAKQVTCGGGSSKSRCTWHTAGVLMITTHIGAQKGVKATAAHMAYSGDNSRYDARGCAAGKWRGRDARGAQWGNSRSRRTGKLAVTTHMAYSKEITGCDARKACNGVATHAGVQW